MKIAFFGTPLFTTHFLDYLKANNLTPSLIITGPDVPIGRKQTITSPQPKIWAENENIRCLQPDKNLGEITEILNKESWDLFIVIAYGKILPEKLINIPKYGTINVHYSLLPRYRGASPVEHAILNGDHKTGVCIQKMVYELDAGDIISEKEIEIDINDNHIMLRDRLNSIAMPMLLESIKILQNGSTNLLKQNEIEKSITKKIKKTDGEINLNDMDIVLWRKYQAYYSWPGTYFYISRNDKNFRVKISKAHFENNKFIIDTVIPEGKKEMSYVEFLRWNN